LCTAVAFRASHVRQRSEKGSDGRSTSDRDRRNCDNTGSLRKRREQCDGVPAYHPATGDYSPLGHDSEDAAVKENATAPVACGMVAGTVHPNHPNSSREIAEVR
jgi:hypothetical protein